MKELKSIADLKVGDAVFFREIKSGQLHAYHQNMIPAIVKDEDILRWQRQAQILDLGWSTILCSKKDILIWKLKTY
jgi:hypothetical protein